MSGLQKNRLKKVWQKMMIMKESMDLGRIWDVFPIKSSKSQKHTFIKWNSFDKSRPVHCGQHKNTFYECSG